MLRCVRVRVLSVLKSAISRFSCMLVCVCTEGVTWVENDVHDRLDIEAVALASYSHLRLYCATWVVLVVEGEIS